MKRFLFPFIPAVLLTMLCVFQASWASQIYVTESRNIILRARPSNRSTLISEVSVGLPVTVLKEQSGWSFIHIEEEGSNALEGWIQSRFLGTRPPKAQELTTENAALLEKLAALQKEKDESSLREMELSEQLKAATDKADKLQADYDSLAEGSANYLKLKEEYDSMKTALASAQESVQSLIQENENLKLSGKVKWFVSGAAVLLAGWLIGIIMGRTQKKRGSYYRF